MIDIGTFSIDKVPECEDTCIDGIRVIFQKNKIDEAVLFCQQLKEKGYIVSANAVMITKYKDDEIVDMIRKFNGTDIDIITFVDTYGIMYTEDVLRCYDIFDKNVKDGVKIGFHSHNTIQMSLANAISLVNLKDKKRDLIIDSTIFGIGKGAGNLHTELILSYMNKVNEKKYCLNCIMETIENDIKPIRDKFEWGFVLNRFVSTINNVYYKYTDYYLSCELTYKEIEEIEEKFLEEDKFNFSIEKAQKYLNEYNNGKD